MITTIAILLFSTYMGEEGLTLKPLPDALWKGTITLEVDGPQYIQYLANQRNENGDAAFVKEKGQMAVHLTLTIQFLLNALGEYEVLVVEAFRGDYDLKHSSRSQAFEEVVQGRLKYRQKVQISETRETAVRFEADGTYDRESLSIGNLRVLPSGRLDKKGSLRIDGSFAPSYEGTGTYTETWERQPLNEATPNSRKIGTVTKTYNLPLEFTFTAQLREKPVSGSVQATGNVKNPFPPDEANQGKATYRDALKFSGAYQLTPLFK